MKASAPRGRLLGQIEAEALSRASRTWLLDVNWRLVRGSLSRPPSLSLSSLSLSSLPLLPLSPLHLPYHGSHLTVHSTMENAEPSSQTASSSYKDGISLSRTIEAKRRRLEDLSFSSPGPAFTSSSDVGDEESDADGATRRKARIRASKQQPSTILSTNASHQTNKEASQPLSDPVRSSPLFRNFSNSMFRKLDKTAAINGKQHKVPRHDTLPSPRFPNGEPHHSSEPSEIGVVPGPSTLRKSSKSSPPDRSKMTPPFGARLNGASPSSAPRPVHTSPGLAKASSPTKRERLITQKKQELDRVYKDHDSLVRELFHLTKVRTPF